MTQIRIRLTDKEIEKLERIAIYKGISITQVIRDWVNSSSIDDRAMSLFKGNNDN